MSTCEILKNKEQIQKIELFCNFFFFREYDIYFTRTAEYLIFSDSTVFTKKKKKLDILLVLLVPC